MPKLTVLTEGIEPTSFELTKEVTSVGRVEGNDIVLPHQSVSGSHGELVLRGEEDVYVRDVGSTNGSYINGNKVAEAGGQSQTCGCCCRMQFCSLGAFLKGR